MKRIALPLLTCAALTLGACATVSESRFNPLNWFGGSTPVVAAPGEEVKPLIPEGTQFGEIDQRSMIDNITAMRVDRTPNGAIVRATGLASTIGQFNAQLVPTGFANGTLTLEFRVEVPAGAQTGGENATRTITAARALDFDDLAGVRRIQVQGARNARTSSR